MSGRILAIGDVHGSHRALTALLGVVGVCAADTVIFLGDLVDRGPSSRQVVEEVLALRARCRVIVVMGNHEEMMRDALSRRGPIEPWLDSGGRATVASYGGLDKVPSDHIRLLATAEPFWESDTTIFVHASFEPELSMRNQTAEWLRWKPLRGSEQPHVSGKRAISGHTPQRNGLPLVLDGRVCIDTSACGGQFLTCLDVNSDDVVQASESGLVREFRLAQRDA